MSLRSNATMLAALALTTAACNASTPTEPVAADAEALHRATTATEETYTLFESGQVRPLALAPSGKYLYAVNTPDNRLEVFAIAHGRLKSVSSVMVGLEPVAVAARSDREVWVVNHLSVSVSIVDLSDPEHAVVTRTLVLGDD